MKAEAVGLSASRLARLDEIMKRRYVDSGRLPGVLTMVYRRGALAHTGMSGSMDLERDKPMREDAIFRIYSMSKPITAVALMMLVEEGALGLDDDVAVHIPAWKNLGVYATGMPSIVPAGEPAFLTTPVARPMKVVDLVTHTSGLTYGFMNRTSVDRAYRRAGVAEFNTEGGLDAMIEQLSRLPLEFSPGTAWNYSVSIDVMGYLVQKLSGMSFGEFLRKRLFEPLGMNDTGFWCPPEKIGRLASCYQPKPGGGLLLQDDADRSTYAAAPRTGVGWGRDGVDRARLHAVLPDAAGWRHARRRADPEPQDGRVVQPQSSARQQGVGGHGAAWLVQRGRLCGDRLLDRLRREHQCREDPPAGHARENSSGEAPPRPHSGSIRRKTSRWSS